MTYWADRCTLEYYDLVRRQLCAFGPLPSLLDIGCLDTPVATWGSFTNRYTIDPLDRPALPGVTKILGTWPAARPLLPLPISIICCLQTIEHVAAPRAFAQQLFPTASVAVILSVPWGWPAGQTPGHLHDPIDAATLLDWTNRQPDHLQVVGRPPRAVATYYRPA